MSAITPEMQEIINTRVKNILEVHANCLIEDIDVGSDTLNSILERAREPISNEEFEKRELAILFKNMGEKTYVTRSF